MAESQSTPRLQLSIEGVIAIIIGILLVITPMNALTRSGFLLFVLLLTADLAWRTVDRRHWRYLLFVGMALAYSLVVTALFVAERNTSPHPAAASPVVSASPSPIQTPTPPVAKPNPNPSPAASRPQKKSVRKTSPRCSAEDRLLGRC